MIWRESVLQIGGVSPCISLCTYTTLITWHKEIYPNDTIPYIISDTRIQAIVDQAQQGGIQL